MENRRHVLIKALRDESDTIRTTAAEALECLEIRGRLGKLHDMVQSGEKIEKLRAIYALGNLRGQQVINMVLWATKDEIEDVRAAAYRVLGKIGDTRVLPYLVEGLKDASVIVARVVIEAMNNFNDPQLLSPLMHQLKSKDHGVVERALEFIGRSGDSRAEEAMIYFSAKGNQTMRNTSLKSLGVMEVPVAEPSE
ncbi:MAG: HEAT repeat domain-containing protein [Deltaproteobacteria bacterium]|nr:HEAT repeat domain-containing protein [Deltaproteobacteria bacterium]